MIKLKDLLTENREGGVYLTHKGEEMWFPAHTRRTLSQLMPGDRVALYPKLMNSIIGKQKVSSFHVSDLTRYKQLKKVIGKKKSISTFSHVGKGSGLDQAKGIQTMGGLAFHVEGFLLGKSWEDIMSTPDKTGRRWVNIEKVVGEDSEYAFRGELEKQKLTREDYNERLEKATKHLQNDKRSYIEVEKDVKKISNQLDNKFIKDWMDVQKKFLMKNKKVVFDNMTKGGLKDSYFKTWNEILIYDVKIKSAFVLNRVEKLMSDNDKKELKSFVGEITYGSPANYRKWLKSKGGQIIE
jgi:hypothetical protein